MQVIILCGGKGTRIQEETQFRPKPMLYIGNKPILWHIMKIYAHYGFNEFVTCLGYKGEVIKKYFVDYKIMNSDLMIELGKNHNIEFLDYCSQDWKIVLADTGLDTLKGGRIKRVEEHVTGNIFMLTYGDGVANIDIRKLLAFHRSHGKIGTVTGVRPPSRFGEMVIKDNKVVSFTEKPQVSEGLINGGFFVFNREFFNYLTDDDNCDFEVGPLEQLAEDGELIVYEHKGEWACMDTFRDMQYLNKLWQSGKAFWKIWEK